MCDIGLMKYQKALHHISRALQFGTDINNMPPDIKLFLVKQPSLVTPDSIRMLSVVNKEFHAILKVARELYHSWMQGQTISDVEVQQALSFSPHLFCYTPERTQQDVHIARGILELDPHALQRCVDVLNELDVLYNAAENKDDFIKHRFPKVLTDHYMSDPNYMGPNGTTEPPSTQVLHARMRHNIWGTRAPIRSSLYANPILDHFAPVIPGVPTLPQGVQRYHYRPSKYKFFKRKEKICREVNKYYMERQIADIDTNNQETFLYWHAQLKKMHHIEIQICSYYEHLTCYEQEYIYQLILTPIGHDHNIHFGRPGNVSVHFGMHRSRAKCLKIIIRAGLEGEWKSDHDKQIMHRNMQKILQDTASLAHVLVGDPHDSETQNIEPTQLQLELIMGGQVYGGWYNHDEWFNA